MKRNISGNVDDIVSAPIDDIPILTADEEMSIAVSDICSHNRVNAMKNSKSQNDKDLEEKPPEKTTENENEESELNELKRQNGLMFQYILSQNKH